MSSYKQFATRRLQDLALDVVRQRGLVAVAAPFGFGKSSLLDLVRSDLGSSEGVAVVEDWDRGSDAAAVERALDDPANRLVVATGWSEPALPVQLAIGVSELSFDVADIDEIARPLLGDDIGSKVAPHLSADTDGWPHAVVALLTELAADDDPVRTACNLSIDDDILGRILPEWQQQLGPDAARSLSRLAHVECFNDAIVATLGLEPEVESARSVGLPVVSFGGGWWRFLDVARRALEPLSRPDQSTIEVAVPELVASRRPLAAMRALRSVGAVDRARTLACEVPAVDLDNENQQELVAVLRSLDDSDSPQRLMLREARASRHAGQLADERDALTQIDATIRAEGGEVDPELEVELLYHRAIAGGDPELAADVEAFTSRRPLASSVALTRWREARAVMWAQEDNSDWRLVDRAAAPLEQAAQEWIEQGDVTRASAALRLAAAAPLYHLGDYRAGQRALRRALGFPGLRTADRALTAEFLCRMSVLAGDLESFDSELSAALSLANERAVQWIKAYLHWSQMHAAAHRQQPADLEAQWQATLRGLAELRDHFTGVVFCAEAASLFAQVGDHARAAEELAAAQRHRSRNELEVSIAEVVTLARSGDVAATTEAADALRASPMLPPGRRWRLLAEQSVAHSLSGDRSRAEELMEAATTQAAVLGLEDLARTIMTTPDRARLAPSLVGGHVFVRLLGEFEVEVRGVPAPLPVGHVATLLKILAVGDSNPVAEEIVVDHLWPDTDTELGLRRLKNVLSRLRSEVGTASIVRSSGGLALGGDVQTDLSVFKGLADEALDPTIDPARRLTAATEALPMLNDDLLPTDLYAEWTVEHRRHLRTVAAALFQFLLSRSAPGAEPSWLLTIAARQFSDDEALMFALARKALAEDDGGTARSAMEMAVRAADELGVPLTAEAEELGRQVGVPARQP